MSYPFLDEPDCLEGLLHAVLQVLLELPQPLPEGVHHLLHLP
jgi:hypothetical protein